MTIEPPATPTPSKRKDWQLFVAILGVIVAIVGIIVGVVVARPSTGESGGEPAASIVPSPAPTDIPTQPPTSASNPTALEEPTASTPSAAAPQAETYVDDYVQECRVDVLTAGAASINGTDYAHTILQWAGDTSEPVTIKRKALRFKATVGIRDDASDEVRVKFELLGDGRQLFRSRELSFGESQKVDVSVERVLRLTLRVRAVSQKWGYAGWGDARLIGAESIEC